jgi:SHS2 domain-containing protein
MHELFEHTADLGIRVRAADLNAVFAEAALGLFSILVANLDAVRPVQRFAFRLEADRLDDLLHDWLAELLFTSETKRVVFSQFDAQIADGVLEATAWGETIELNRHILDKEVKAITYHGLKIEPAGDGFLAEIVVDL